MNHDGNMDFLVRAAQRGDALAKELVVQRFRPLVEATAKRLAPEAGDVDDLIQEATLALLRALREFRPAGGAPFAWYAKRQVYWAVQAVVRRLKKERARCELRLDNPSGETLTLAELLEDPSPGPEEIAVAEDMRCLFQSVWATLTERQRQVLALRSQGLTFSEIAKELGISPSTAKGVAARGREQIKKYFQAWSKRG
ncbi:MAG: RNA polymerase sigma factor [bacterium]|jgi:RNA polymerase sigma factor (sigma-70 family)